MQLLQLQPVVGVGFEPAKASLIYPKVSVVSFDSDVVLKKVKHISVMGLAMQGNTSVTISL